MVHLNHFFCFKKFWVFFSSQMEKELMEIRTQLQEKEVLLTENHNKLQEKQILLTESHNKLQEKEAKLQEKEAKLKEHMAIILQYREKEANFLQMESWTQLQEKEAKLKEVMAIILQYREKEANFLQVEMKEMNPPRKILKDQKVDMDAEQPASVGILSSSWNLLKTPVSHSREQWLPNERVALFGIHINFNT
uniref:Uncharacterized protein n=1 Tax=Eptatretus burgeri TaxID=7764 RepID=A0A8C4RAE9_EPTBU